MNIKVRDTSVYPITMPDGEVRHVQAANRCAAIVHVFKPNVSNPLTGGQVADLVIKYGPKAIEVAGEKAQEV